MVRNKLSTMVTALQLGAGTRNGTEAAAHSFLINASDDTSFLKLDLSKAFNTLRRDCIAQSNLKNPTFFLFYSSCYKKHSFLSNGDYLIKSYGRFQQGDPIASEGFFLAIHRMLLDMKLRFKATHSKRSSM